MRLGKGKCKLFVDLNFVGIKVEVGTYVDFHYKMLGARAVAQFCKDLGYIPPIDLKAEPNVADLFTDLFMYYYDMIGEC